MFTRHSPLLCSEASGKTAPEPESKDLWLSTLRSPEFSTGLHNYNGHDYRRFYQKRPKEPEAKEVRVRANVMDIIEIDQLKETFTATFKLQFEYVDPTLITTWQIIKYRKFDGKKTSVATVEGHILGYEPGHFEAQKVVLGKRLVKTVQKEKVIDADDDMEVKYAGYVCVPKKDLLSVSLPEDHNWQNHLALEWTFMNLVVREHQFIFESRHINFFDELGGHVTHEWKIQATFSERLHLKEMPFDRQLLRIQVVGEIPNYMMKFTPLFAKAGNLKNIEARENCNLPVQWTVDAPPPQLQVIKEQGEFNRARFDLHIYVERNPRFYTHNVCLLVWLFTQGSGVAFANRSGTHDSLYKKLNCLLILLLMTVGCKILFAAWLPAKPYLTRLDKYLLLSFFFQTLVILYVAFEEFWDQQAASILTKESIFWRNGYDVGAAWVYGAYLLGHICLAAMIYFDCKLGILQRESWHEVYRKKFVWPRGTKLKQHLAGPSDERAGKPIESDSDSEAEDSH